jgi:hypothetical protein
MKHSLYYLQNRINRPSLYRLDTYPVIIQPMWNRNEGKRSHPRNYWFVTPTFVLITESDSICHICIYDLYICWLLYCIPSRAQLDNTTICVCALSILLSCITTEQCFSPDGLIHKFCVITLCTVRISFNMKNCYFTIRIFYLLLTMKQSGLNIWCNWLNGKKNVLLFLDWSLCPLEIRKYNHGINIISLGRQVCLITISHAFIHKLELFYMNHYDISWLFYSMLCHYLLAVITDMLLR